MDLEVPYFQTNPCVLFTEDGLERGGLWVCFPVWENKFFYFWSGFLVKVEEQLIKPSKYVQVY